MLRFNWAERTQGKRWMKKIIFIFPIAAILLFLYLKEFLPGTYEDMIQEDAVLEYLQAVSYLLASIVALVSAVRFGRRGFVGNKILYFLLFAGLLFIFFEEISWGQRIFHIGTPQFFQEHNIQNEISLHNLAPIQRRLIKLYILVGLFGSGAWFLLQKLEVGTRSFIRIIVPDWFISSYFYAVFCVYAYFEYMSNYVVKVLGMQVSRLDFIFYGRDQEPAEFLMALGFLLFTLVNCRRSKQIGSAGGSALPPKG